MTGVYLPNLVEIGRALIHGAKRWSWRAKCPTFFYVDERLRELSAKGDDLERLKALLDT